MGRKEPVTTKQSTVTAVYEAAEEGGYVVSFPALPGLVTEGETLDEARAMAVDAVRGYLEALQKDGRPLPESEAHTAEVIRDEVTIKLVAM